MCASGEVNIASQLVRSRLRVVRGAVEPPQVHPSGIISISINLCSMVLRSTVAVTERRFLRDLIGEPKRPRSCVAQSQ